MTIERKLLGTTPVSGEVLPEAVSFDGTNDYLSRSSDLTGNSDGKTFTFSCWVYGASGGTIYHSGGASFTDGVSIHFEQSGELNIKMDNPSGSTVFSVEHGGAIALNTWNHLLISCDMSSTSNRHIYVNDVALGNNYLTYTNSDIDFTSSTHSIVQLNKLKGRLAHLFLDYTYRDLSTTSNRRLFIDADGKPSSTIPSSPILYLPLIDAATAGSNSGTGGDFTVNGVLATAERGPNQDNCSASNFATAADTLLRSDNQGWVATKTITCSFTVDTLSSNNNIYGAFAPSERVKIKITSDDTYADSSTLSATFNSAANANDSVRFILTNDLFMRNKHSHITFSFDASDTSKRHLYVNGEAVSANWLDFNNTNLQMNNVTKQYINSTNSSGDNGTNTNIGEFYMANAYYDLATDNPFWDSTANRPNSVRKVIEDTGVTPLIALPIVGSDAGNNLGSGGDFTVNSGPFVGARGGSEFFARSVDFDAASDWFYRSSLSGVSNSKHFSAVFAFNIDAWTTGKERLFTCMYGNKEIVTIEINGSGTEINSRLKNTSNSTIGYIASNQSLSLNQWYVVMLCMDLTDSNKSRIYIDSVNQTLNSNTVVNENIPYTSVNNVWVGNDDAGANNTSDGSFAICYYNNTYIDFSQETNRHKFADQLGYPKNLTQQIEDGDIPNPLVYMKFDPTVSLGTNSGTGGDFSVTATPISGPDVTP